MVFNSTSGVDCNVAERYDRLFKDVQLQLQCEPATGLLLLFPKHCIHVLEVTVIAVVKVVL